MIRRDDVVSRGSLVLVLLLWGCFLVRSSPSPSLPSLDRLLPGGHLQHLQLATYRGGYQGEGRLGLGEDLTRKQPQRSRTMTKLPLDTTSSLRIILVSSIVSPRPINRTT